MKLLIVRHAIAMDRDEYQSAPEAAGSGVVAVGHGASAQGASGSGVLGSGALAASSGSGASARGSSRRQIHRKSDDLRPLTPEGIRKMRKNARGLATLVSPPAVLITSPLTRASQTASILNDVWKGLDVRECAALKPDSKPVELVKWLRAHIDDEAAMVCLVGHEPHLTELIGWFLTGSPESTMILKKGGACLLDFEALPSRAAGKLLWHVSPAILRSSR